MHASDQALGEPSPDSEKLSCPIWVVRPRAAQPPYVPDERSDHQRAGPLDGDDEITVGQALASIGEYRRVQAGTCASAPAMKRRARADGVRAPSAASPLPPSALPWPPPASSPPARRRAWPE